MSGLSTAGSLDAVCHHLGVLCCKGKLLPEKSVLRALRRYTKTKQLSLTRRLHALVVTARQDKVPIIADHFIRMFAECRSLHEANLVFRRVDEPNVHTWNAIISAHITLGECDSVFNMFNHMINEGIKPDKFTYMNVFKVCGKTKNFARGRSVHNHIVGSDFTVDVIMGNTIVDMYAKCGSIELACKFFNNMPFRDKVTWNSMIGAYIHNGNAELALQLFGRMQSEGVDADRVTFLSALKACALVKSLEQGKMMHKNISKSGLGSDVGIGSTLIDMYIKCGSLDEAHRVFDALANRTVVSWGAIIDGYAHHGRGLGALSMFEKMQLEGIKPDAVILASVLKACGAVPSIMHGNIIYEKVIKHNLDSDVFVVNNIFYMYAKAGRIEEARKVFDHLANRDVISWATMIAGYALNGQGIPALYLFKEMQQQGISPDEVTFSCIIKACGMVGATGEGKIIHDNCCKDAEFDAILANCLIDMYGKCGNVKAAHKLFDALPSHDIVSWNSLITAYVQDGQGNVVFELLEEMQQKSIQPTNVTFLGALKACVNTINLEFAKKIHIQLLDIGLASDVAIKNALIDTYSKCGGLDLAQKLFDTLKIPDAVSWGAMIGGYVHNGNCLAAMQLFKETQDEGFEPGAVTLVSLLKACRITGALEQGQYLHKLAKESGLVLDVTVGNALMDMYAKCGHVDKVLELFKGMPTWNAISWNTIISAFTLHGHDTKALKLFEEMLRTTVKPDEVTFSCILKACSNVAFVGQGRCVHNYIIKNRIGLDVGNNILLDMHLKCGIFRECKSLGNCPHGQDVVWDANVGSYPQHSYLSSGQQYSANIVHQEHKPASSMHLNIPPECSHTRLADGGYPCSKSMDTLSVSIPALENFTAVVDHLGRAGRLDEAEELLQTVPSIHAFPAFLSLLTACKAYGNRGRRWFFKENIFS